jgi:hypothetical protein
MRNKHKQVYGSAKNLAVQAGAAALGLLVAGAASATATDYSSVTSGVDASTIVLAIVAMGAIMILPNVAKWGVKKLATFF